MSFHVFQEPIPKTKCTIVSLCIFLYFSLKYKRYFSRSWLMRSQITQFWFLSLNDVACLQFVDIFWQCFLNGINIVYLRESWKFIFTFRFRLGYSCTYIFNNFKYMIDMFHTSSLSIFIGKRILTCYMQHIPLL